MLLDVALGVFRRDVSIPGAFRINHGDGTARAAPETRYLGPIRRALGASEVQLFHPALDVVPGGLALFERRAVPADADEQVAPELADAE